MNLVLLKARAAAILLGAAITATSAAPSVHAGAGAAAAGPAAADLRASLPDPHVVLPPQDAFALREARPPRPGEPLEIADVADVVLGDADASVVPTADGRAFLLRVVSPGSTDVAVGLSRCVLPEGARLFVRSAERRVEQGPWTARDVPAEGTFWLPAIPGDDLVLEADVPEGAPDPTLEIAQVARGYRDLFGILAEAKSASCNVDVACPLGDDWRAEIRSVARYVVGGRALCTGTLLADVPRSGRPWFLTAEHCGISGANDQGVVVYWRYEASACGGPRDGPLTITQVGAIVRAERRASDFTLVELEEEPPPDALAYYSGWDASAVVPAGCVGIHHPSGDEKAICRSDDPLVTIANCIGGGQSTHWLVDDWEEGITEPGSSGSGIWDPATHRLVGTLSGGSSACTFLQGSDCYGKLAVHWSGGNSATSRLRDWLDPGGTGALVAEGHERPCVAGDASGDRVLSSEDVSLLRDAALGLGSIAECGDVTCEGAITVADVVRVIAAIVGSLAPPARCLS